MNAIQAALRDGSARGLARQAADSAAGLRRPMAAMLDQALVSGASFAAVVLIGRAAGEQQLGLYALAATLVVLAVGVQESLVLIPYTVFAAGVGDELRRRYAASALVQSAASAACLVACLGAATAIMAFRPVVSQFSAVLLLVMFAMPAALARDFARRLAFAQLRLGRAVAIDGAVAAVQLSLLGWLAYSGMLSAATGVAAWGAACCAVALGGLWRMRSEFRLNASELRGDWRRSRVLGKWLVAGHVTGISQAYALHWLLALLVGTAGTGEFAAVTTIVSLANPLIIGLGNFLMPATANAFARSGAEGVWRLAIRATAWLGAALAAFCTLCAVAGDWAMTLIYGERFGGQAGTVTLLSLAASAAALGLAAEHALRSMDRPRAVFLANLLALATTLTLAAWLVPAQGTVGAAWSLLAGNLVGCLVRWAAFARVLDFEIFALRPSGSQSPSREIDRGKTEGRNGLVKSATGSPPAASRAAFGSLGNRFGLGLLAACIIVNDANFRVANPNEVTLDWQTALRLALCGLCGGYAVLNLRRAASSLARFPMAWLLLFTAWAAITLPYAIASTYAAGACAALVSTSWFAAAVVARVPGEAVVKTIVGSVLLLAIGCWIAQFTRPDLGQPEYLTPGHEPAGWRLGGLTHPNGLGAHCALAIGMLLVGRMSWNWNWISVLSFGAFFGATLICTGSRTSCLMLAAAGAMFLLRKNIGLVAWTLAAMAGVVLAGEAVGADWNFLLSRVTRENGLHELATFTGRTDLWTAALDFIAASPLRGYGYGCSRFLFLEIADFPATHPHNLFLDTAVELGIIGLLIEAAMFVALARRFLVLPRPFADMALVLVFVMGLFEAPVFNPLPEAFTLSWMLALGWRGGDAESPKIKIHDRRDAADSEFQQSSEAT